MKACPSCNQVTDRLFPTDSLEWLACKCYNEDPRTYWSVIGMDGFSRGSFKTKAAAKEWVEKTLPRWKYTLREYANAAFVAPAFNSEVLKAAVSKYWTLSTESALADSYRQETAEWMHQNHPIWIAQFNMDLVEWILVTYHGFCSR